MIKIMGEKKFGIIKEKNMKMVFFFFGSLFKRVKLRYETIILVLIFFCY